MIFLNPIYFSDEELDVFQNFVALADGDKFFEKKEKGKMLENNGQEIKESGKMMAVTMVLTNFLLLVVTGGIFWLVQLIISDNGRLNAITREFILL